MKSICFFLITYLLASASLVSANTPETTAYFRVTSQSLGFWCDTQCQTDPNDPFSVTIETNSQAELTSALNNLKGLSTLDGQINTHHLQWTANFPFLAYQSTITPIGDPQDFNFHVDQETYYPYIALNSAALLIPTGNDSFRIENSLLLSDTLQIAIGNKGLLNGYFTAKDFGFAPVVVPLPAGIWLFTSVLSIAAANRIRQSRRL